MARPGDITSGHVRQAIATIRQQGVPAKAQSTRYDLVDPATGERFPPKLVLSLASEISGQPLSRKEFSGGDQTNPRLQALGFEIVGKVDRVIRQLAIVDLAIGDELSNDELVATFAVGNSGGMRYSSAHGCLVLVADHTKGLYDDRWDGEVLLYTGMGRIGDQTLSGQNGRLAAQRETELPVHLFEVFEAHRYRYIGRVQLAAAPQQGVQRDDAGQDRSVYIFPLRLMSDSALALPTAAALAEIATRRRRLLRTKTTAELVALAKRTGAPKPGRREVVAAQFQRSEAVAELAKRLAVGRCGLCREAAPFECNGAPYLECHHIHRLADGGADTVENTIALCPNCHRRMHILAAPADVATLRKRLSCLLEGLPNPHPRSNPLPS